VGPRNSASLETPWAIPLFERSRTIYRELLNADRNDNLLLGDMKRLLDGEEQGFEYAADPFLAEVPADRHHNLQIASERLEQEAEILRQLIQLHAPDYGESKNELASVTIRLETIRQILHTPGGSIAAIRDSLAVLKQAADQSHAPLQDLEFAATAFLNVKPTSLRDPRHAVRWSERGVEITHHKNPEALLLLSSAYRANGESAKAIAIAEEGLSRLTGQSSSQSNGRIRRLLQRDAASIG
jgi:hypothetical protein